MITLQDEYFIMEMLHSELEEINDNHDENPVQTETEKYFIRTIMNKFLHNTSPNLLRVEKEKVLSLLKQQKEDYLDGVDGDPDFILTQLNFFDKIIEKVESL